MFKVIQIPSLLNTPGFLMCATDVKLLNVTCFDDDAGIPRRAFAGIGKTRSEAGIKKKVSRFYYERSTYIHVSLFYVDNFKFRTLDFLQVYKIIFKFDFVLKKKFKLNLKTST